MGFSYHLTIDYPQRHIDYGLFYAIHHGPYFINVEQQTLVYMTSYHIMVTTLMILNISIQCYCIAVKYCLYQPFLSFYLTY